MKKTILKVLLVSAALSALLSMSAFADGWQQTSSGYQYIVNDSPVFSQWKSIDNSYYYFDADGIMAADKLIDGERYVGSDGRMVTSSWRSLSSNWYYFDSNGKMVSDKAKQIDGYYYYFGEDGVMATGWVTNGEDTWYYCDTENGHMLTSAWKQLAPHEDMDVPKGSTLEDDGTYWFYFLPNGSMVHGKAGEYKEYTIDGQKYAFDEYGRMSTGWIKVKDTDPVIAGYKYYNDDASLGALGTVHTGWLSAYPPEGENIGYEVKWYYFDANGTPYYGTDLTEEEGEETLQARFKKLTKNGKTKTYLFDQYGNPVYGLRRVRKSNGVITSMYFGTQYECCLQLGEKNITEADGTNTTFYFDSQGYGYNGVKGTKLYYMGKPQKAVDDTYAFFTVSGTTWLVSKNGTVTKNYNRTKDSYEVEYKSDASGKKSGGQASDSELQEPSFVVSEF